MQHAALQPCSLSPFTPSLCQLTVLALLFSYGKGIGGKNGSGKVARLQGCKLHEFFDGEMRRVSKILYNIYITN